MIEILPVETKNQEDAFVDFHYQLYEKCPQWVPPFKTDIHMMLNKKKHPFYEHSDSDFYIAMRDGEMVGRIAALENKPFNAYHGTKDAEFYLFDSIDDQEVANALFDRVVAWAKSRGLNRIVGPKGYGPLDGYGIQIEGFEHRQMMNMMNYNYPYYQQLAENYGFVKEVDFVSSYLVPRNFQMPEKVLKAVEIAKRRNVLRIVSFDNKRELRKWIPGLRDAYNKAFIKNWEYYPLSKRELDYVVDNAMTIVIPKLIKFIVNERNEVVGFVLPFPDISAAMQKNKGKLGPIEILRLLRETKKTEWLDFNGIGILPEYQGMGGNAIIFDELSKAANATEQFKQSELTQVAETAVQMRKDLANLGAKFYKNHRVYKLELE